MHGQVPGLRNQLDRGQVETLILACQPYIGAMGAGDHPERSAAFIRASDGNSHRQAIAVIGVPPLAAVLVPGQVGNPLHHIQWLDQRLYGISFQPTVDEPIAADIAEHARANNYVKVNRDVARRRAQNVLIAGAHGGDRGIRSSGHSIAVEAPY